jgi:polyhydroxyalkanoate synthesis regulator phasin
MKKYNFLSKTTVCLITVSMSIFLFAGCQSSSTQAASTTTQSSSTKNSNKLSPEEMKKKVQDNIQPLVTAGTITQDQADKIVTAYTTRATGSGQNKSQDKQQNNQQGNTQNKQKNNPLTKLVTDGVITQAQADAVMPKMKGNSTRKNNGQSSQSNNGQSSN